MTTTANGTRSTILDSLHRASVNNAAEYTRRGSRLASPTTTATAKPLSWREYLSVIEAVPTGYYALERIAGPLGFIRVTKTHDGRTFIAEVVGAPGSFREIRMPIRLQWHTARHILNDLPGSIKRFADEFVRCSKCLSPLTTPQSRARGYGPKCARHYE